MKKTLILSITLGLAPFAGQATNEAYKVIAGFETCMGHGYTQSGTLKKCLPEAPKEGCDSEVFSQLKDLTGEESLPSCDKLLRDAPLRKVNPSLRDDTPPVLKILKEERQKLMGS